LATTPLPFGLPRPALDPSQRAAGTAWHRLADQVSHAGQSTSPPRP
jgi:hypothetical protein